MTNREIASVLFNISTLLSAQHDNPYRVRAYRRAARAVLRQRHAIAERVAAGESPGVPGLGKRLTATIRTLATTGSLPLYDELCERLPPEQRVLLKVPGLGPRTVARIHLALGATDPDSLRRAATTGRLQRVWGVGPKRTADILNTLCPPNSLVRQEPLSM